MPSLSLIDVAVASVLAGAAGLPYLSPAIRSLKLPTLPWKPAADRWQSKSVETLIGLQGELEARKMTAAVKLCRELIWEVIGGDAK